MMRRIEIEAHNIPHLVDQQRIGRELKALGAMWLQSKGPPDAADRGLAQPGSGRQHAAGPVRSSLRSLLPRQPHNLLDLLVTDLTRCSRTGLISQPHNSFGDETVAPKAHSEPSSAQLRRHRRVACSCRTLQNDTGTKSYRPGAARLPRHALQLGPLRVVHHQLMLLRSSTTRLHTST